MTRCEALGRLNRRRSIVPRLESLEERMAPAASVSSPADQLGNIVSNMVAGQAALFTQIQSSVMQIVTRIEEGITRIEQSVSTAIFRAYDALVTPIAQQIASLESFNATFCPPCPSPPPFVPPPPVIPPPVPPPPPPIPRLTVTMECG